MKAIVSTGYGRPDVLQIKELEKPVPKEKEVLIKIYATTVTQADRRFRIPEPVAIRLLNGLIRPKLIPVLGLELAGEVEAVGNDVKRFTKGDQVFAFTGFYFGAYAEYKCMAEEGTPQKDGLIAKKPVNLSFEEAAAVPCGGLTALGLAQKVNIRPDQKVLIYGASGSVGTYAVQLAKFFGAQVTGVCSTSNLELVKSLGADTVIDYTRNDFTKSGETYDVIIDAVHKKSPSYCKRALKKNGVFLTAHTSTNLTLEDFFFLTELVEAGKIRPVIDRVYPFEQVAMAHSYVDLGHKKGNVVINVNSKHNI